jgi:hypothetical protein
MSQTPEFRSSLPKFAITPPDISPKFVFVSINKPEDIRNASKRTTIRSHARKDARRRVKKQNGFRFVYEPGTTDFAPSIPNVRPLDSAGTVLSTSEIPESNTIEERPSENLKDVPALSSIVSLRPLGAGRGYNPFASFPIESTPRVVQLIDSCRFKSTAGDLKTLN